MTILTCFIFFFNDLNGIPGIQLVLLEKRLTIIPEAIYEKA